jgi:hypothetical protein
VDSRDSSMAGESIGLISLKTSYLKDTRHNVVNCVPERKNYYHVISEIDLGDT